MRALIFDILAKEGLAMDLPLSALWWFIAVFGILIVGHESAHVIMTRLLGGQVEGWIRPSGLYTVIILISI